MKKDIPQHKVVDLAIAIVPRQEEVSKDEELWDTYIINFRDQPIQNVLISSKGYGELDGERLETTNLRHFFDEIGPLQASKIEPIQVKLFDIANEYWVSFTLGGYMYDKKYVFVKGSISKDNFTMIPFINELGVMIK